MPSITRFIQFYRTHGLVNSLTRIPAWIWKDFLCREYVLYTTDLYDAKIVAPDFPPDMEVVRRSSLVELTAPELEALVYYRGEKAAYSQLTERFDRGAQLWILKHRSEPVGVIWSIRGKTIEPHFLPLTANDIHLFDNEIFQEFRGNGFNRYLMLTVFKRLQEDGCHRVHGETKVRNHPKHRSNRDLPFRKPYAVASKFRLVGRTVVVWRPTLSP